MYIFYLQWTPWYKSKLSHKLSYYANDRRIRIMVSQDNCIRMAIYTEPRTFKLTPETYLQKQGVKIAKLDEIY